MIRDAGEMYREKIVAFWKSTAFIISPVNFKGFVSLAEPIKGEDTNWIAFLRTLFPAGL